MSHVKIKSYLNGFPNKRTKTVIVGEHLLQALTLNCRPEKWSCWHTKNRISMIETINNYFCNECWSYMQVPIPRCDGDKDIIVSCELPCFPLKCQMASFFFLVKIVISLVASRVACKQALHGKPTRRTFSQPADSQLWWFFKMIICELIGNHCLPWTFSFIMFCNRLLTCHYVINNAWLSEIHSILLNVCSVARVFCLLLLVESRSGKIVHI